MTNPALAEQLEKLHGELDRIEQGRRTAEQRFARLDQLTESISAIEASATSPNRAVTVVAGAGGAIKSVRFTEHARELSPAQLSEVVTSTIQAAVAESARNQASVVQEFVPESNVLDRVLQTQREALGLSEDELAPAPQPTQNDPQEDEEGFTGFGRGQW